MGYVDFETENASYRLEPIHHSMSVADIVHADAMIAETGGHKPNEAVSSELPHLKSLFDFSKQHGIDVFLPDISVKYIGVMRNGLMKIFAKNIPWGLAVYAIVHKIIKTKMPRRKFLRKSLAAMAGLLSLPIVLNMLTVHPKGKIEKREILRKFFLLLQFSNFFHFF